jgi:hypothetical protein
MRLLINTKDSKTPGGFSTRIPGHLTRKWNIKSNQLEDEIKFNNQGCFAKLRQKFHSSDVALPKSASGGMLRPVGALSEKSEAVGQNRE